MSSKIKHGKINVLTQPSAETSACNGVWVKLLVFASVNLFCCSTCYQIRNFTGAVVTRLMTSIHQNVVNGKTSELASVLSGVPQGSVLGLLLGRVWNPQTGTPWPRPGTKISILDCKTNMFLTLFILGLYYEVINIHYPTKRKFRSDLWLFF